MLFFEISVRASNVIYPFPIITMLDILSALMESRTVSFCFMTS